MLQSTDIHVVYNRDLDKDVYHFTADNVHIVDEYPAQVEDQLHVALYVVFPGMEDTYPFVSKKEILQAVNDHENVIEQECNATMMEERVEREEEKHVDKKINVYIVIGAALAGLCVLVLCIAVFICK